MITRRISIIPTAEECGKEFAGAGTTWQVAFLNEAAAHLWPAEMEAPWALDGLTPEAKELLRKLLEEACAG